MLRHLGLFQLMTQMRPLGLAALGKCRSSSFTKKLEFGLWVFKGPPLKSGSINTDGPKNAPLSLQSHFNFAVPFLNMGTFPGSLNKKSEFGPNVWHKKIMKYLIGCFLKP